VTQRESQGEREIAARAIKKKPSDIPIIACSAYASQEKMEEALRAEMADYLQKPIPAALMKAKIEEFILP